MNQQLQQMKKFILLTIFVSLIIFHVQAQQAKYVFYFVGDGMGLAHVSATEAYLASINHTIGFEKLSFTDFPVTGFATTHAQNRLITGSAAAGTALSAGIKTTINTVGMDGGRENNLKSIAEKAKENGFKVGIISSVGIDHATPAAFYAHQPHRGNYYQISLELTTSGFDFFGGGGFGDPFNDNTATISVFDLAPQNGYTITTTREAFENLAPGSGKVISIGPVTESSGALRYAIDQDESDVPLEDFVGKAIEMLDNETGFFIMCEEGKIDWAAHSNDAATVVHNVISLSKSVEKALDFYHKHPNETLIIITADHETGGLALGWAGTHYESDLKLLELQKTSSYIFTNIIDSLMKIPENRNSDFLMKLVEEYFGLGGETGLTLSAHEQKLFNEAYAALEGTSNKSDEELYIAYNGSNPLTVTATRILNNRAGLSWCTWSHTAIPVPVFAIGAGQEMFNGYYDNTDIPKKIEVLMGLGRME